MAFNVVSRDEHVSEVKRHIWTLKEWRRAVFNTLSFRKMTNRMILELVYCMKFWLHPFPARDGVSASISPRGLVTGVVIDANKHCVIPFGEFVQTHDQNKNTMASRKIDTIALRPTGNAQGGYYFYFLQTGRPINCNRWTEIPMTADVVQRVQKITQTNALKRVVFGNRWNEEDEQEEADFLSIYSDSSEESVDQSPQTSDNEEKLTPTTRKPTIADFMEPKTETNATM